MKRWVVVRDWLARHRTVVIATAVLATAYITFVAWNHTHYETHAYDLGIFSQAVWHLSRFEIPVSTIRDVPNLFGDHFHPILILFAPFAWLFRTDWVLVIGQALILAATLPTTYALARQLKVARRPALIAAIAAGIAPGFAPALGFDVHEIAFVAPLIPLAFLFAEQRRWKIFAMTVLLLLITKESMGIYVGMIGFGLCFRRLWKPGLIVAVIGILYSVVITTVVLPHLNPAEGFRSWERYDHLAKSPLHMPAAFLSNPSTFITSVADAPDKRSFTLSILGGAGLIALVGLAGLPLLALSLLEVVWSEFPSEWSFAFHYPLLPSVAASVGALYGLAWLSSRFKKSIVLMSSLLILVGALTVHISRSSFSILANQEVMNRPIARWNEALKRIPPDATVSASDAFVPRLSERNVIYRYPRIREAQWLILDSEAPSFPFNKEKMANELHNVSANPRWTRIYESGTLSIFFRNDTTYIPDRPDDPATRD